MAKSVVLIGDSIRMGYQATVRENLAELAKVYSPSVNCQFSTKTVDNLDEWVIAHTPDVVHINAGLHDIRRLREGDRERQVPVGQYRENLRTIFSRIRQETEAAIIYATTTPVDEAKHNTKKPFDRFNLDIEEYNAVALEVAADFDVEINDLHKLVAGGDASGIMTDDGVHFTPKGSELLGQVVAVRIIPHL